MDIYKATYQADKKQMLNKSAVFYVGRFFSTAG
jgi:hypothetical protein